jgi:hypothetical protein
MRDWYHFLFLSRLRNFPISANLNILRTLHSRDAVTEAQGVTLMATWDFDISNLLNQTIKNLQNKTNFVYFLQF